MQNPYDGSILNHMDVWERDFDEAIKQARAAGRGDVADYISLKSSNDAIRSDGVQWLLETVVEIATAFNEHGARIILDQKDEYLFEHEKAVLTGSFLKLQQGVRCLTFEAGWTRNPGDGFMRGGALVFARIRHFGFPKSGEDLALIRFEGNPQWFTVADDLHRISFDFHSLRPHFEVFLK